MLTNLPIVGFIPITDASRARQFYIELLKLEFVEEDEFSIAIRVSGAMIRLVKMEQHTPSEHAVLGWETPDISATAKEMTDAGITFERYPYFEHNALGIWTADAPSTSRLAWFKDPDGNVLSLSQH